MTGSGSRFVAAGYKELKPFIKVQGKPIIQWIVEGMYPNERNIVFICRQQHLDTISGMKEFLMRIVPTAKILSIRNWNKSGPVGDIVSVSDEISDHEPCIVNYCDFFATWNFEKFKNEVGTKACSGSVPCYTGFHPHLIYKQNVYASCLTDKDDNLVEIREKYSFEADKTKAKHSPGIYYFKSGAIMKKYFRQMMEAKDKVRNEYYVSLAYNYMVKDGHKVWVPTNVDQFCQWGTPLDLADYVFWTECVRKWKCVS